MDARHVNVVHSYPLLVHCLQTIAQREVAALLGINSGRGPKDKRRRQQNIIVQVNSPSELDAALVTAKSLLISG